MLIKNELSGMPVLAYPQFIKKDITNYSLVGTIKIINLPRCGEILVADVFNKNGELKLRFFSDSKNALICNEWPTKIWHMKLLDSVLQGGSYFNIAGTNTDAEKARKFLGVHNYDLGSILNGFISKINSEKAEKAMERKYAKMNEHFCMYPEYPADLESYCEAHVFNHSYIFMDKLIKGKGKRHCVCAHCNQDFELDKGERSGDMGTCPKCGITVRYRGAWIKSTITDKAKICIANKVNGQLLLRWADVQRVFQNGNPKYQYSFDDYYYNLYIISTFGPPVIYAYSYQSNMGYGWNWYRKKNGEVNYKNVHVYSNNLTDVFGENYYHVNFGEGLRGAGELSLPGLLDNLKNIPVAEYLFKLGLTQLAAGYVENLRGSSFTDVLGVSKQYLPLYKKFNVTSFEHKVVKSSQTWVDNESFAKLRALRFDGRLDDIIELMDLMSFERFANYFTKQKKETKQKNSSRLLIWYKDYISMSKSLGVDLSRKSVRFPKNIETAHNVILESFNKIKRKLEDDNFIKASKNLYVGMQEYAKGDYCIVFPKTRSEFITEGQSLKHCVGGDNYYQNHLKGKAIDLIPSLLIKDRENRLKICPRDEKLMRDIEDGFLCEINKLKQEKEGTKNGRK